MTPVTLRFAVVACALLGAGCGASPQTAETRTLTVEVGRSTQASDDRSGEPEPDTRSHPEVPGAERCDGAREPTTEGNLREAEMAIRCLTNAVRKKEGLSALGFDERLARAAATRSKDMVDLDYFVHDGPDGGNVQRAVRRTGYVPERRSWLVGENIGAAPGDRATPAVMMRTWLDSPTHRADILSEGFTEMGVGAVAGVPERDGDPGATYTQIFGATGKAARSAHTAG